MKPKQIPGVPIQKGGGFHDTESEKSYENPTVAAQRFEILKQRFFSINQWRKYAGEATADFKLYDASGNHVERAPKVGDFIRIDIPGPGQTEADGYDWVEITHISDQETDNSESILMTCRPSKPLDNKNSPHIAHFYGVGATSNFMIARNGSTIKAAIYGRNEKPNFRAKFIDKIRNFMIAIGGIFGMSKIQWKSLSDGLLDFD